MAQVMQKSEINRSDLRKCGEISACFTEDKEEFYLDCLFCEFSYLQLGNFIQHIYNDHVLEFPRSLIKGESRDLYDSKDAKEENVEVEPDLYGDSEDSEDMDAAIDDFETILLSPVEADVKKEFSKKVAHKMKQKTDETDMHVNKEIQSSLKNTGNLESDKKKTGDEDSNAVVESDPDENTVRYKPVTKQIKITDALIDVSQCIILAEIYKKYTCLWDENDIAYRFNNRRDEALKSAWEEFNNKTALSLTEYEFEKEVLRLRKICSYEKKQKIICTENKSTYEASCIYYDHIEYLEVDVAPFVCSICGEQYPALGKLKVHVATHDGSKPFICKICGRGFGCGNYFTIHLRRHAQDLKYTCDVCDKSWATTTEKIVHMRTHTGEKPYVCSICGSKWTTTSQLIEHTRRHNKDRCFQCEICRKLFYSTGLLREHMKTHVKVRAFVCDICDKGFKCRKHLTQHKRIHDEVKRYLCKICGKRFAQCAGLSGHMKSHGTIATSKSTDNQLD